MTKRIEMKWYKQIIKCGSGFVEPDVSYALLKIQTDDHYTPCVLNPIFQGDVKENIQNFLSQGFEMCLNDLIDSRKVEERSRAIDSKVYGTSDSLGVLCYLMNKSAKNSSSSKAHFHCFLGEKEGKKINSEKASHFSVTVPYWLYPALRLSSKYAKHEAKNDNYRHEIFWYSMIPLAAGFIGGIVATGVALNLLINSGVQIANAAFLSGGPGVYVGLIALFLGLAACGIMWTINSCNKNKTNNYLVSKKSVFLSHHSTEEESSKFSQKDKLDSDCSF